MKTLEKLTLYSFFFCLLSACQVFSFLEKKPVDFSKLDKLVEISKGACFGRCPVYTMIVYTNGTVSYNGKDNTEKKGLYTKQLTDSQLKELKKFLETAKLEQFQDGYKSLIPDLPTITIAYYGGEYEKRIVGKDGRPEVIMALEERLDEIASSGGWTLVPKENANETSYIVENQIRLQLQPNVDINAWIQKYQRQQMRVIQNISATNSYWLLEFNAERNNPREVLGTIQADPQIVSAEFNRTAQ